jgi:hypothetical protein
MTGRGTRFVLCAVLAAAVVGVVCGPAGSRVAARPELRVTPPVVEFGAARGGAVRQRTVTITNMSDDPVPLSAGWSTASRLDPGFGFPTGDSCLQHEIEVLEAGQSCSLVFTFSPVADGVAEATFVFSLDGWQSTAASVRLTGRAAP